MSPESKTSNSGFRPAPYIIPAISVIILGELITAPPPNHIVLRSSVQISGFSSTACWTRILASLRLEFGAGFWGSSSEGTKRPPGPQVRLMIMFVPLSRIRFTTSR